MSNEKSITNGTLADAVLSVLNHPDTPAELYSAIQDTLLDMAEYVKLDITDTKIMPFALPMILERLGRRGKQESGGEGDDVASLLSRFVRHPDAPQEVATELMETILEYANEGVDVTSPEFIGRALANKKAARHG